MARLDMHAPSPWPLQTHFLSPTLCLSPSPSPSPSYQPTTNLMLSHKPFQLFIQTLLSHGLECGQLSLREASQGRDHNGMIDRNRMRPSLGSLGAGVISRITRRDGRGHL